MKKLSAISMALIMSVSFAACGGGGDSADSANTSVPEGTEVVLDIHKEDGNKTVFGVGTELDPHFFSQNVGLSGTADGKEWECKESDWEIFEERIAEMNLKRIRAMLLPSWFVISEENVREGVYDFDSTEMASLYRVLDTATEQGIKVNITMWGVDVGFMKGGSGWVSIPKEGYEETFVACFADCIKYLIEDKGYDCITEVTLYNEPNSLYSGTRANEDYCNICMLMHGAFQEKGIRDKVLFNLSDDARDYVWLAKTLMNLEGIVDVANSHIYTYGDSYNAATNSTNRDMSNEDICYNLANYNLNLWKEYMSGYDIPHIWGEFGTQNGSGSHTSFDKYLPDRGLDIARIVMNFFNMGSVGASYWVLFSQYYSRGDFSTGNIMDMGLWGFADEGYACRPVYYAYSMITRFIEEGDVIFPLESTDGNIVGVAFKNGSEWSYCVVNNGDSDKKVSFVNYDAYPASLDRYVYDEAAVPTDNKVIPSDGSLSADGRVLSDTVKARSFVVYTNK